MFGKYKSKPSIFTKTDTRDEQTEESRLPKPEAKLETPQPSVEDQLDHIFKEKGVLYKFVNEWICIGEGTAIVLEEEEKLRFVFLRTGLNTFALNFWVDFDTKAQATGKSVRFFSPEIRGGKASMAVYAIKFGDDLQSSALAEMLGKSHGASGS